MENGSEKWNFQGNRKLNASSISVRGAYNMLMERVNNGRDMKPLVPLCRVDPTDNPLFRTTPEATDSVSTAVNSYNFNCYPPTVGLPDAKRECFYHHRWHTSYRYNLGLPLHALVPTFSFPRPGYPQYDSRASCCLLEVRHFDLLPERGREVDLDSLESQADENTVAMVLINPSNPCGSVLTYQHSKRVAEIARNLGIFVISDEVYAHVTYGSNPFVPMGVFSSIAPVITIGSLSKRWLVHGWRSGWIATCDPHGIFQKTGVMMNDSRRSMVVDYM